MPMMDNVGGLGPIQPGKTLDAGKSVSSEKAATSFKDVLMQSIKEVNALQKESENQIEALVAGRTENVAEVMSAVKKAELTFDMMMEVRNKLMDAYDEIRQMRI